MAREDKLVERITYLTKIALGEGLNKDFSEAILQAAIKAAKVGYSFAVDETAEWLDENMKEAGYEWDADKKELKEIVPKKLDSDKVIAWLVANICDYEYFVKLFKKDFGL